MNCVLASGSPRWKRLRNFSIFQEPGRTDRPQGGDEREPGLGAGRAEREAALGECRQQAMTLAIGLRTWGYLWLLAAGTPLDISRALRKGLLPQRHWGL